MEEGAAGSGQQAEDSRRERCKQLKKDRFTVHRLLFTRRFALR